MWEYKSKIIINAQKKHNSNNWLYFQTAADDHWKPPVASGDYEAEACEPQGGETIWLKCVIFSLFNYCQLMVKCMRACVCVSVGVNGQKESRGPLPRDGLCGPGTPPVSGCQAHARCLHHLSLLWGGHAGKGHLNAHREVAHIISAQLSASPLYKY